MTFQVKCISIYSHDGRRRDVPFELGKLNIVTGRSETGKSTLVSIINYCLGSDHYQIPVDVIHDSCSWFGVLFQKTDTAVFVARPKLPEGQKSHSAACVVVGTDMPLDAEALRVNANTDVILETLGSFCGIGDIKTAPEDGRTTDPIQPSIRHARDLLLQPQSVLANEKQILYGTDDYFEKLHLRDCMPYFLGVVREDFSQNRARMREVRRELKLLELNEQRMEEFSDRVVREAAALRATALDAGMQFPLSDVNESASALDAVRAIANWVETEESSAATEGEELPRIRAELAGLDDEIEGLRAQLDSAQAFAIRASSFADEGARQDSRLRLLSIFGDETAPPTCPLCTTPVHSENTVIEHVLASAERLSVQLQAVERQRPRLAKYLEELREEIATKSRNSENLKRAIYSVIENTRVLQERQEASYRRARISGKAAAIVTSLESDAAAAVDGPRKRKLLRELRGLEALYDDDVIVEGMKAAETVVSSSVSQHARSMNLAQSDTPLIFDLKDLTLRFVVGLQTVTLERIGAQKNWVGYHIAVILALHGWFSKQRSPVPSFAVFDQVSQPFFSNESLTDPDRTAADLVDEDRAQVLRMIEELYQFCKTHDGRNQIILTEHIESNEQWFKDSVAQTWRGGNALVPEDWPRK